MLAADTLEALGVPRGQYVVKVNSRKILDGVLEAIGVGDEKQKLAVLRAIDKLDRLGLSGVGQLLGEGRTDESGDFTKERDWTSRRQMPSGSCYVFSKSPTLLLMIST